MERVDTLFLSYFYGNYEIGLYNIALKLAVLIMFLIIPLNSVLIPKISQAFWGNDQTKLKQMIKTAARFMFWASLLCLIFILLCSEFLLSLFGVEFINAKNALLFLSIGFFFNAIHGMGEHLLNISGNEKKLTSIFSAGLVLNIFLNYLLIPLYGIDGAAFASMCSMILWNSIAGIVVSRHIGISIIYLPIFSEIKDKTQKSLRNNTPPLNIEEASSNATHT